MKMSGVTTLTAAEAEESMKKATQQFKDTMSNILAAVTAMKRKEIRCKDEEIAAIHKELSELKMKFGKYGTLKSDLATKAMMHLAEGKRHLIVKDIKSAVETLEKACSAFAEEYGETAEECGDAYFYYGSALLELSRLETGVIAVGEDKAKENEIEPKTNGHVAADEESKDSEVEEMEETKDDAEAKTIEGETDEEMDNDEAADVEEGNDEAEVDPPEEEEIPNIQLAWEVLELAKNIFYRQSKTCKDMENKLAETYLKLGEISLESENYSQSIEDLCQCLFISQKNLTPDDRKIAEVHYQLGNAYTFDKQYMKGKVQYDLSLKVLNKRMVKLREAIADRKPGAATPLDEEAEIEEIQCILKDIAEKIADMEDLEKEVKFSATLSPGLEKAIRKTARAVSSLAAEMQDNAQAKILEFGEGSSASNGKMEPAASTAKASPPKPAPKDISHLVKRKRDSLSAEEDSNKEAAVATKSPTVKKVKVAEPVLANGTAAAVVNGKADA